MRFEGEHLYRKKTNQTGETILEMSSRVCCISVDGEQFAVADMLKAGKETNPSKPRVFKKKELAEFVRRYSLEVGATHDLPAPYSMSDDQLRSLGFEKWMAKRDDKYWEIEPLTSSGLIQQYLFGRGLGPEIQALIPNSKWNSQGAFINALNRFITFGLVPNALLSVKCKNSGKNFPEAETPDDRIIKRGAGGKNNQNARTSFRGITLLDKKRIKEIAAKWLREGKKLSKSKIYQYFEDNFLVHTFYREVLGRSVAYHELMEQSLRISKRSFFYHFNRIHTRADLKEMEVGHISFEKDYSDRQGSAIDGVLGATHRYEVDATVLDLYVRYPYDKSGRFSMGRPILYVVIDVYSTMIVGFYLGFDGPNVKGVAQAMANACLSKVEFAARYNLTISEMDWPAAHIPIEVTIDNGTEYPIGHIVSVLKSMLGIIAYNFVAVFRGDAKGTVESAFDALNDMELHYEPGSIFKDLDRTEQHPSNHAVYDYDSLVRKLILLIIERNKSADRLKRLNFEATVEDIGISPESIYLHSLKSDMDGGRPTKPTDKARVIWAFLPEEEATVRSDCVYFNGLQYHSPYFKESKFYEKAKHHGRFKIVVKRVRDWVNNIFYRSDSGQFVLLELKTVNGDSRYSNGHWESVLHLLEWEETKKVAHAEFAAQLRQHLRSIKEDEFEQLLLELHRIPENQRKGIVPRIKEHKDVQKRLNTLTFAREVMSVLGFTSEEDSSPQLNDEPEIMGGF